MAVVVERVDVDATTAGALDYTINSAALVGHGIAKVDRYIVKYEGGKPQVGYVKDRTAKGVLSVEPENILGWLEDAKAILLGVQSEKDVHFQLNGLIDPQDPDLYRARFRIWYQVGQRSDGYVETDSVFVFQKADGVELSARPTALRMRSTGSRAQSGSS